MNASSPATSSSAIRIAVLFGGMSLEREVSLRSGHRVADALAAKGHDVTLVDVGQDLVARLLDGAYDLAFLALHGAAGEDGTIQSILDLVGLPYTGPDAHASALAWNKPGAQGLYHRAGARVPANLTLSQTAFRDLGAAAVLGRVLDTLGPAVVVKPATGGSSLGLSFVDDPAALPGAVVSAFSYGDRVLIEQRIVGTEIAVSLLDGVPLPAVEIQPVGGAYDYGARYTAGATEFHAPARIDPEVAEACAATALIAWHATGARHLSRADLVVDADGTPYLLELDTCPGLTETSLLPLAARAAGQDFPELCTTIVDLALAAPAPEERST